MILFLPLSARTVIVGLAVSLVSHAMAQTMIASPPPEKKSMGLIDPAAFGFGRAGFTADFSVIDGMDFNDGSGSLSYSEMRLIAPIGAKKWRDFLFAGSIGYNLTEIDFDGLGGLSDQTLHNVEAQLTTLWKPQNSRWSAMSFFTPAISTDFTRITGDDMQIAGLALLNYRVRENLQIAGGAFGQYAEHEGMLVPALGLIWRPEPFIVQLTPPFAVLGWRATERLTLAMSAYPSGGVWDIDGEEVNRAEVSGWQCAATVSYQFTEHIFTALRGGLNVGAELEMQDADGQVIEDEKLDNSPFIAWNIRYLF